MMNKIVKPMLAGKCTDTSALDYPVFATPKLDGVRCLTVDGQAMSRTFKHIPNKHIYKLVSALPNGLDGELMCDGQPFSVITGNVMREDGESDFFYAVFDYYSDKPYVERMAALKTLKCPKFVRKILPVEIKNEKELLEYETKCLSEGYEGCMVRAPNSPYKAGRSSEKEQFLLKIKRFADSEAKILEIVEKTNNENVAEKDAFGRSKHSSAMAGLVLANTMGALKVKDIKSGVEFSIGSGFNDEFRAEVWANKKKYLGQIVKYKSQEIGAKDAPRFPVYLGMRDKRDM